MMVEHQLLWAISSRILRRASLPRSGAARAACPQCRSGSRGRDGGGPVREGFPEIRPWGRHARAAVSPDIRKPMDQRSPARSDDALAMSFTGQQSHDPRHQTRPLLPRPRIPEGHPTLSLYGSVPYPVSGLPSSSESSMPFAIYRFVVKTFVPLSLCPASPVNR